MGYNYLHLWLKKLKMEKKFKKFLKTPLLWGSWVAHSGERPALDFGSDHDSRVVGLRPALGSVLSVEPA